MIIMKKLISTIKATVATKANDFYCTWEEVSQKITKLFLEASRLMLRQLASRVSVHSKTLLFFYPDLTK